eukprot:2866609-Pleurochrysis_carterae.AAC.1
MAFPAWGSLPRLLLLVALNELAPCEGQEIGTGDRFVEVGLQVNGEVYKTPEEQTCNFFATALDFNSSRLTINYLGGYVGSCPENVEYECNNGSDTSNLPPEIMRFEDVGQLITSDGNAVSLNLEVSVNYPNPLGAELPDYLPTNPEDNKLNGELAQINVGPRSAVDLNFVFKDADTGEEQ